MKPVVFGHTTSVDYKYACILKGLDVDYRPVTTYSWLRYWWKSNHKKEIFHVRYLQWRGYLGTMLLYGILIASCKIRKIPILWTCHNILEHRFPAKWYNNILRKMMSHAADKIVVFHEDLKQYLAPYEKKVVVSNFGEFRSFLEEKKNRQDAEFGERYEAWLEKNSLVFPDIVFVGDYSEWKQIELLLEFLRRNKEIYGLVVSYRLPCTYDGGQNVFLYREKRVFEELLPILDCSGVIGYVGHRNLSVPTGIHMFASFGIPVLGYATKPVSTMLQGYGIGEVFSTLDDMDRGYQRIRANYQQYAASMRAFCKANTWRKAQEHHRRVIEDMVQEDS